MSDSYLIVGLGNPGKEYARTRHNVGFLVLDQLALENKIKFSRSLKYAGFIGQGIIQNKKIVLLKPQTYMNRSGLSVKRIVCQKAIDVNRMLIVSDDFHLDFGALRLRPNGSDGGHNGLASIIEQLETRDFARLRIGIGHPPLGKATSDFVLSLFQVHETKHLDNVICQGARCCEAFLTMPFSTVMNLFNKRNIQGGKESAYE